MSVVIPPDSLVEKWGCQLGYLVLQVSNIALRGWSQASAKRTYYMKESDLSRSNKFKKKA